LLWASWPFAWLGAIDARGWRGPAVAAAAATAGCLLLTWRAGVPIPAVHDEFANLLGADTYAHGRLANPTPELAAYFESPHVLVRPVYMSKYPPGQALFMAAGQLLTGRPIVGVWFSIALACAAIAWMLQAWMPARWALVGGLIAALRLSVAAEDGRWSQSYWGGAVAVLGASLMFGAARRLIQHERPRDALLLAAGLLILAISRPFEGFVASLPVAFLAWRNGARWTRATWIPLASTLSVGLLLVAVDNALVTGAPWRLPHAEYQRQYGISPMFLWQDLRPAPTYPNPQLERYNKEFEVGVYRSLHTASGYLQELWRRARIAPNVFLGFPLLLCFVALPWRRRGAEVRFAIGSIGVVALALTTTTYYHPHYAAPTMPLFVLLAVTSLRQVRTTRWRGIRVGRLLAPALAISCVTPAVWVVKAAHPAEGWERQREIVRQELEKSGGQHLVIVRYDEQHSPHQEWVYNGSDLDHAPIIWVHELAPAPDVPLLAHFATRKAWLVDGDQGAGSLKPYLEPKGEKRRPLRQRP
jgi:hypothetical protein